MRKIAVTRSIEHIKRDMNLASRLLKVTLERDMTSDGYDAVIALAIELLLGKEEDYFAPTGPFIPEEPSYQITPGEIDGSKAANVYIHQDGLVHQDVMQDPFKSGERRDLDPDLPPFLDRREKKPDTQAETTGVDNAD